MISGNRDILVERLEQKLSEKEREIEEMRDSLKESIISELREGMKDDLDFDKRITHLEKKVKDMGLAYDGVMKELLDQKTVIKDFKNIYIKNKIEHEVPPPDKPVIKPDRPKPVEEKEEEKVSSTLIIAESEEKESPSKKKKT